MPCWIRRQKLKAAALVDAVGGEDARRTNRVRIMSIPTGVPLANNSGHAVYLNDLFDLQRTVRLRMLANGRSK